MPQGPGYWALTRYADVMQVSRDPDTFHSAPTHDDLRHPARDRRVARFDDQHGRAEAHEAAADRQPRLHAASDRRASRTASACRPREIVERIAPMGECDFVAEIAAALPLQIICDMMGIPREDNKRILELTNVILGVGDPEYVQTMEELMGAGMALFQYGLALGRGPRREPARRHHELADGCRDRGRERSPPPHLQRARVVLPAARRGRQRDDSQRDQPRHVRADRTTRSSARSGRTTSPA